MIRVLVSACLMGQPVRYDGRAKTVHDQRIAKWRDQGRLISICPEMAAGMPVPRAPAEIMPGATAAQVLHGTGAVHDNTGLDVTQPFVAAANLAVRTAAEQGCQLALLTDRSPSCGSQQVYGGAFDGALETGRGLVAEALVAAGVAVYSEHQIDELETKLMELEADHPCA